MRPTSPATATEPFRCDGGDVGILLCHGFTGSPASLRPWADRFAAQGYTVRLPLLPGHGTTWQQLNRTTFDDWLASVAAELGDLAEQCGTVVVCGLSMGGALALRLAQLFGDRIAGLVLVNPSVLGVRKALKLVPVLKLLVPSLSGVTDDIARPGHSELGYHRTPLRAVDELRKGWTVTRAGLDQVTVPVLLLRSRVDHVVEPQNSQVILAEIASADVTEIVLERSFHVATLDYDAEVIFEESLAFVRRLARERTA